MTYAQLSLLQIPLHIRARTLAGNAVGEPSTWSIGRNRKLQSLIAAARLSISSAVWAADKLTRSLHTSVPCVP